MDIIYNNIEGLFSKLDEVKQFICKFKPSILGLAETHITKDEDEQYYNILNYEAIHEKSSTNKTGGVTIYIHNRINFKILEKLNIDKEIWIITIEIKKQKYMDSNNVITILYRSPAFGANKFIEKMDEYLEKIDNHIRLKTSIILGDFNINMVKTNDTYTKKLNQIIQKYNYKQHINEYTRITNRSATIIDLLLTNKNEIDWKIINGNQISDHEIIQVKLNQMNINNEQIIIKGKIDFEKLIEKIQVTEFNASGYDNFENKVIGFIEYIEEAVETCRKQDTVIGTDKYNRLYSPEVEEARKEKVVKFQAFKIHKNLNSNQDIIDARWIEYKNSRNKFVKILRQHKKQYYSDKIDKCEEDQQKTWKVLKEILNIKQKKINFIIDTNGEKIDDHEKMANKINSYILESIETLNEKIKKNEVTNKDTIERKYQNYIRNINEKCNTQINNIKERNNQEIKEIVNHLKGKGGNTQPNTEVLKKCWGYMEETVKEIIDESFEKKVVPRVLKVSNVIPIPKTQDKKIENLRPINILPNLEKILENIVHQDLTEFVNNKNILSRCQSGFRTKHSTETALQCLIDDWKQKIDQNKIIIAVFVDLKRAFETIDRKVLLKKLYDLGIRGDLHEWLSNYLEDRYQETSINNTKSKRLRVKFGVPQGSKLGPLLFILYINELPVILKYCLIQLFADDTLMYIDGTNIQEMIEKLHSDLQLLWDWLNSNGLSLNTNKTKIMIINEKSDLEMLTKIKINEQEIEYVKNIKYLGIEIDNKLKFNLHYERVIKKINQKVSVLNQVKYVLPKKQKITLYNTLIKPHIKYCNTLLYFAPEYIKKELQKAVNRAGRIILNANKDIRTDEIRKKLQWSSVNKELYVDTMTFIYRIEKRMMPDYLQTKKNSDIHQHETRGRNKFYINNKNKARNFNTLLNKGLSDFNKIKKNIKESRNINQFRINLMKECKL